MNHKKTLIPLPLMVMTVWTFLGCQSNLGTAKLNDGLRYSSVDIQTKELPEKSDVFSPDTPVIFRSVKRSNASAETTAKSDWISVRGNGAGLLDSIIGTFSFRAGRTIYISFSLTKEYGISKRR